MGRPRFLIENFFNPVQFTAHTVTSNEETTGYEDWRVGTARRTDLNYWTPLTANAQAYVQVKCDRSRAADMIAIDRNHNLAGKRIRLRVSDDAFSSYTEVFSLRLPSTPQYAKHLDESPGAYTEEGAWVYKFPLYSGKYWRFLVDAMGAGQKPRIGGLYLGKSFQPDNAPPLPWDDEPRELAFDQIVSPTLWVGANRAGHRKATSVTLRMDDTAEYDEARYHFHGLYWKRRGFAWYVPDDEQAERSWLAYAPPGTHGAPYDGEWPYRTLTVELVEHEPEPL